VIVRTIVPKTFSRGSSGRLKLHAPEVTDYTAMQVKIEKPESLKWKKFFVGDITVVGVVERPEGYDDCRFSDDDKAMAEEAQVHQDTFM